MKGIFKFAALFRPSDYNLKRMDELKAEQAKLLNNDVKDLPPPLNHTHSTPTD